MPVECPAALLELPALTLVDLPSRDSFNEFSDERKLAIMWAASSQHRTLAANLYDQLGAAIACVQALQASPE